MSIFFFGNPSISCSKKLYTKNCVHREIQTANQIVTFMCLTLTGQKSIQKISETPRLLGGACDYGDYVCSEMLVKSEM